MSVLIVSCEIKISKIPDEGIPQSLIFILSSKGYITTEAYKVCRKDVIIDDIEKLRTILRHEKSRYTGQMLIYNPEISKHELIKISPKSELTFSPCDVKVTICKSTGKTSETNRVSFEEKAALLIEFMNTENHPPSSKEKFKDVDIGTFYNNIIKHANIKDQLPHV